jgi:inosine-uridine nucleoside N-ribohydrolase
LVRTNGGPIFDALAVVAATRPELVRTKRRYAKMDAVGNLIVTDRLTSGSRTVRYSTDFRADVKRFVMERLMMRRSE